MSTTAKVTSISVDTIKKELLHLNRIRLLWNLQTSNGKDNDDNCDSKLTADYKFKNFPRTWTFLNEVAKYAHETKHHPTINTTYNKVNIELTTHDVGNKVTYNDIKMAQKIHQMYLQNEVNPNTTKDMKKFVLDIKEKSALSNTSKLIEGLISRDEQSNNSKNGNGN